MSPRRAGLRLAVLLAVLTVGYGLGAIGGALTAGCGSRCEGIPPEWQPPREGTFSVLVAPDPAAVGGTATVTGASPDGGFELVVSWIDADEVPTSVEYLW